MARIITEIQVSILVLVEGILQYDKKSTTYSARDVSILVLVEGILQYDKKSTTYSARDVSILVLVEGILQLLVAT